jgi:hypothetical protein
MLNCITIKQAIDAEVAKKNKAAEMTAMRKKKAAQKAIQIKALREYADKKAKDDKAAAENLPFRPDPRVTAAVAVSSKKHPSNKLLPVSFKFCDRPF